MDFNNRFRHKNYNQFNDRFDPTRKWRGRGRRHFNGQRYQQNRYPSSDVHQRPHYDRFEPAAHSSDSWVEQIQNDKSKYDTLVVELGESGHHFTEQTLRQLFQQTYGTVKKINFNATNNKAFITFYSPISVDMCIESGGSIIMNGYRLKVYPFQVDSPQGVSASVDRSFHLKNLCKSTNLNIKGNFPSKQTIQKPYQYKLPLNRKELMGLIIVNKIDKMKLLNDLIEANDIQSQFNILINALELKESDIEKRFKLKNLLEDMLNSNGFECKLLFFGSTVNGLGFQDSDIDLFIELHDKRQKTFDETISTLKTVQTILRKCLKMFITNPIPSLRCPLVKLDFNVLPSIKNSNSNGLVCDISLTNPMAERNSHLIRLYTQLDSRFHKLCYLLRFWAKSNGFVGTNHISSYAFTHLVLFFFQNENILPSVDELRQKSPPKQQIIINGWNCSFNESSSDYETPVKSEEVSETSLIELLKKFFDFYSSFDFSNLIICTKTGSTKHKCNPSTQMDIISDEEIRELPKESAFKLTPIISIEDPFELTHNLCANLNYRTFDKFCDYIISISRRFETIFIDKPIGEQTEDQNWSLSYLCQEWDPTPNGYVFPENFLGFFSLDLILNSNSNQSPIDLMQTLANRLIDLTNKT